MSAPAHVRDSNTIFKKKNKKKTFNTGSPQNYLNVCTCICIHITNKPVLYVCLIKLFWTSCENSVFISRYLFFELRLNSIWLRIIPGMMKYPLTNENYTETRYVLWYHECCHQLFDTHLVLSFRKKEQPIISFKEKTSMRYHRSGNVNAMRKKKIW